MVLPSARVRPIVAGEESETGVVFRRTPRASRRPFPSPPATHAPGQDRPRIIPTPGLRRSPLQPPET